MVATAVYGVLIVCAVALVAVAGLEAVRRLVPAPIRQKHNDVASLDEGAMWPTSFALKDLGAAEEARIGELVGRAAG